MVDKTAQVIKGGCGRTVSDWLYRRADESRPAGALSLDEIDELYEQQVCGWRVN